MKRSLDITQDDLKGHYQDRQVSAHLLGGNLRPEEKGLVYHHRGSSGKPTLL